MSLTLGQEMVSSSVSPGRPAKATPGPLSAPAVTVRGFGGRLFSFVRLRGETEGEYVDRIVKRVEEP